MDALIQGNKKFATPPYNPPKTLKDLMPTLQRCLVITCMDPRVVPEEFLGFKSSQYGVVRNAGGRTAGVTREVAFAAQAAGLKDIVVIHHADCGLCNFDNKTISKRLADKGLGDENTATYDWGEIKDLNESIKFDVETLRKSPYVAADTNIHGFILDLMTTGEIREVYTSLGSKL